MRFNRLRNWLLLAGLALLFLALDQVTKWLVVTNLAVNESWAPIPALSRIFTVTHVQNTGVAFGQLGGLGWVFMAVNLAVFVGVLVYYPRIPAGQWQLRLAAPLLLAGDLGNPIDRVRHMLAMSPTPGSWWTVLPRAYVTDFMDFKIWPVFNVADMCVVAGVIIVAWTLWRLDRVQQPQPAAEQPLRAAEQPLQAAGPAPEPVPGEPLVNDRP